MRNLYMIFLFMSCITIMLNAQVDSNKIIPYKLGAKDILTLQKDSSILQLNAGLPNPLPASQSPFETYIITQEEIKKYACNDILDVLRLIPSFRTSKVGSAIEGQLFLANAMRGNSNFQFLINDIPIRPYTALGMPLAPNLPIKQADRIEIVLGNMNTIYNSQSSSGVINIIMKESERPVYTSSELMLGAEKFSNIEVNFGGKLGKGKNIIRFNAYGGFLSMNNLRISNDWDNFNPQTYVPENRSDEFKKLILNDSLGVFQSRMPVYCRHVGFDLQSKYFTFSYRDILRRNQSAIGLNTLSVDYQDVGKTVEDNISSFSLAFKKQGKKWQSRAILSLLNYSINPESSSDNYVSTFSLFLLEVNDSLKKLQIKQKILDTLKYYDDYNRIYNNRISAFERSPKFDFFVSRNFLKYFSFGSGLNLSLPIESKNINTFSNRLDKLNNDGSTPLFIRKNAGGYALFKIGLSFKGKSTFVDFQQSNVIEILDFGRNRRFSFSQSLDKLGKNLVVFGNAGTSKSLPPQRYINTNYSMALFQDNINKDTLISFSKKLNNDDFEINVRENNEHLTQTYFGIGIRNPNFNIFYQYQKTKNLYFYNLIQSKTTNFDLFKDTTLTPIIEYQTGFFNYADTYQNLNKIVVNTFLKDNRLELNRLLFVFDLSLGYVLHWGEEMTPKGKIDFIRQTPKHSFNYVFSCRVKKKLSFTFRGNYFSRFYPSYTNPQNKDKVRTGNFISNDFILSYNLSDNLQLETIINNYQNHNNTGIEATETSDDLRLNMQQKRFIQIAFRYNLDKQK